MPFLSLVMLPWLLGSPASAAAPCELPTDLVLQAEQTVVAGRWDDMPSLVERFEGSLSCAPVVDPGTLAAFLRAEGAWFHLTGLEAEATLAFRSAAALSPGTWTEAFGASAKSAYDTAAATPSPGRGTVQLEPPPADPNLVVHIDGIPTVVPVQLDAGIHALQLLRGPESQGPVGQSRFGQLVAVFPGEDIRVNPGVLPIETAELTTALPDKRPMWLLASAGGAVLVSGLTAAIALNQPAVAREATSLAAVNQAEKRQRAMAFTSYGFLGVGAIAGGIYLAW